MDLVPTLVNAAMIAAVGVFLTYITRTQTKDVKNDLAAFKREIRHELSDVKSELKQEIRDVRFELASVRADLTQIALAVGVRPRPQTG